jgi:microcystin-dependent protein
MDPFIGQIIMFAGNFAPKSWAFCNGQLMSIAQNTALFSLLGTTYGGDGVTTFALPDLRGRVPIHAGASDVTQHNLGSKGGEDTHTLAANEMPQHTHGARASGQNADQNNPQDNVLGQALNLYVAASTSPPLQPILPATLANTGGGQAHENDQPFLAVNFCIALQGLFPSRN